MGLVTLSRRELTQSGTACRMLVVAATAMASANLQAMEIDVGNSDVGVQWGNTVRYNAGWRVQEQNSVLKNSRNTDEGTLSFNKGAMVTNRIDLLSELDVNYRKDFGGRLSAAAWRDFASQDSVHFNSAIPNNISSYNNNTFSPTTVRFQGGLSGEILDAYVFKNFELGGTSGNVKIGRQTVLWGESLILSTFSVSDGQAPTDAIKALATPGVDAKEIALPIGQVSGNLQLTPTLSLMAQYYYEHRASRAPQGGTYLGSTDFIVDGPDRFPQANGSALLNNGLVKPRSAGDFGLAARWSPEFMGGGTLGVYYRDFTEKSPVASLNPAKGTYSFFFPTNERLIGLSAATNLGGISVGAEIVRRNNAALNSTIVDGSQNAARGNAWTGLVNAVALFGPTPVWNSASLTAELGYSYLDSVTANAKNFASCSNRPANDQSYRTGCSTRDNWQMAVRFTPSWTAVFPGWDASVNFAWSYGLAGNSSLALPDHGNQGAGSFSIGTTWTYNNAHDFTLAYIGYLATYEAVNGAIRVSNGSQRQDRGWLSFTYKGSF